MKIALAQINSKVGDLEGNGDRILSALRETQCLGADLVVFPEMVITGYPPHDLLLYSDFCQRSQDIIYEEILPHIRDTAVLIGGVCVENGQLFNASYFIRSQSVQKIIKKRLLPNYEVFNEKRYFVPGSLENVDDFLIHHGEEVLAVFICEDLLGLEKNTNYLNNLLKTLKTKGVTKVICQSASPYRGGHPQKRIELLRKIQKILPTPIYLVNQVGANDNLVFDGNSFCLLPDSQVLSLPGFVESVRTIDENVPTDTTSKSIIEEKKQAIVLGIRDYFCKTNFTKAYLGLSGGIDSALVLALASEALGAHNIEAILMPSKYSSKESVSDATELATNLEVKTRTISIEETLASGLHSLNLDRLSLAEENLQSRIRGLMLMALANDNHALVLVPSNKSEIAVGYSTMYGDSCGALAPIGDLWKSEVWDMAKTISQIPISIIQKEPSAELRPEQKDSDSLPPYELMDQVLQLLIDNKLSVEDIVRWGYDETIVGDLAALVYRNQFKRKQFAPIIKLSYQSFGSDWQYPIATQKWF